MKTSVHQLSQDERITHFSCNNKLDHHQTIHELILNYPILDGKRITIEVNKKVNDKTLNDIDDLLHIAFEKLSHNVKVVVIQESNSFIIVCSFPLILTDLLVATAIKNMGVLKDERCTTTDHGYVNVYSNNKVQCRSITLFKSLYYS